MLFDYDFINEIKKPQIVWHMVNYLLNLMCMSLKTQTQFTLLFFFFSAYLFCGVDLSRLLLMSKYIQQSVFEEQHENSHKKHKFYDNSYAPLIYDKG